MPIDPKRNKALDEALATIEKHRGAIMRMGDSDIPKVDVISTGSIGLDIALGIGGLPKGRISEIYGPESSGKTTIALQAIAQCQKNGGVAAFIDAEHALDLNYAKALGVNAEELLISQPDCGEQALEIAETLVRSNAIDIVVVDSVAALVPRAELNGDMGDVSPGAQARLMSQAMRKLTAAIHKSDTSMLFINQLRMKIGVMFGSPEVTSGGNALKFYASVRMDIRRIGAIKAGTDSVETEHASKSLKTNLRLLSAKLSSIFCTARASTALANLSISVRIWVLYARQVPGTRWERSVLAKVVTKPQHSSRSMRKKAMRSAWTSWDVTASVFLS